MDRPATTKPYALSASVVIHAPPAAIWAVLADFGNVHQWAPTVKRAHLTSKAKSGIGCARNCTIGGMGHTDEVVTEWENEKALSYTVSAMGPMAEGLSSWRLSPSSGGTKVTTSVGYRLRWGPVGRLMHKVMMRRMLKKTLEATQEGLKRRVERSGP